MEFDTYSRSPVANGRGSNRERDDYRAADSYRERRRSPDRRRGDDRDRRRSRSPGPIDRYQPERLPRDDYYSSRGRDDHYRERRRSSPHTAGIDRWVPGMEQAAAPQLLVNPMPDPMKLDFQVGFTWFAEWWRTEQRVKEEKERQKTGKPPPRLRGERETRDEREAERPKIQAAYDTYKENLQKMQAQTFVRLHKHEDWFRERYVPEVRSPFRQRLTAYRQTLFAQWEEELSEGLFDDFTLEGIYKSESNGLGGILEKEEGETTTAAEVLGVGDLVPSKGGDIRDPVAQRPTLLIKTIAPTVTRERFEAFAKEHLGEEDGGYMHLSLSDPNPLKKCHRMGWIILNAETSQQGEAEEEQVKAENADEVGADTEEHKTLVALGPKSTSEKALEKINSKTIEDPERGNFTVHCGVHRPPDAPRKKALWDLFSAPERVVRDLDLATRLVRKLDNELGDEYFGVAKIEERVQGLVDRGLLQPVEKSKPSKDFDMDEDREEGEDEEEEEGMIDDDETDDAELLIKKKKLDLLVEYLRRVYNFCFFCVHESDSVHELQRKCPGGHLRRPRMSLTSAAKDVAHASAMGEPFPLRKDGGRVEPNTTEGAADESEMAVDAQSPVEEKKQSMLKSSARNAQQLQRAYNWVKTFEEKIMQLLEPENVDLRKLGGTPLEEGVEEELSKFFKQEDVNKYRCKVLDCVKLFKAPEFWRKHVEKRHAEFFERVRFDVQLVNTYVVDPAHIAPSRSDANSNGHFPLGNNGHSGTPRNFQLNPQGMNVPMSMGMGFNPANMPPNAMISPQMLAAASIAGAMPSWPGMPNMTSVQGGVGPIRNHGGRGGHLNGGFGRNPYARHDGRGRMPSFGAGPGARGGAMAMMGMPDGVEGGSGAIGPLGAVQGRTLRTYEDLDVPGEKKVEELDY